MVSASPKKNPSIHWFMHGHNLECNSATLRNYSHYHWHFHLCTLRSISGKPHQNWLWLRGTQNYRNTVINKIQVLVGDGARNDKTLHHDDVIKWKHFSRYWPFVRGIHRSPVNSPHKGQWRGALMFYLFSLWINIWVNNREIGDLRCHCTQYDVIVMILDCIEWLRMWCCFKEYSKYVYELKSILMLWLSKVNVSFFMKYPKLPCFVFLMFVTYIKCERLPAWWALRLHQQNKGVFQWHYRWFLIVFAF